MVLNGFLSTILIESPKKNGHFFPLTAKNQFFAG
jgi:hypothetical protein